MMGEDIYAADRRRLLLEMEEQEPIRSKWIQASTSQCAYKVMIKWLVDTCDRFGQSNETLFLATSVIGRFLARQRVVQSQMMLACGAALWIASKYEEVYEVMDVHDVLKRLGSEFRLRQILAMERRVLQVIDYQLAVPTIFTFLCDQPEPVHEMARSCLSHWSLRKFKASVIADAIIYIALKDDNGEMLDEKTPTPLGSCVREIVAFL